MVPAESVSAMSPSRRISRYLPANQIVEVRYLYAYPGGSLYQPVYLGARDDIQLDDCTIQQLKFKVVDEVEEA